MNAIKQNCPACGDASAIIHLTEAEAFNMLDDQGGGLPPKDPGYEYAAYWCNRCQTPFLVSWPLADVGTRRKLAGLPEDLVEIDDPEVRP